VQEMGDAAKISITTADDCNSSVGGAVACRNSSGSEEFSASDP